MEKDNKSLGKGLNALLGSNKKLNDKKKVQEEQSHSNSIPMNLIDVNVEQPRKRFDSKDLEDLKNSIMSVGLIQPIVVKKHGDRYRIIAGERRFRACKILNMTEIPAVVKEIEGDADNAVMALVENIHRKDLNPMEVAESLSLLKEDYDLTQEEISNRVAYSRQKVSHFLMLLSLSDTVQELMREEKISFGHGKVLAAIKDEDDQTDLAYQVVSENLSVRALESLVKEIKKKEEALENEDETVLENFDDETPVMVTKAQIIQKELNNNFGIEFKLKEKKNGSGTLSLNFKDEDELEEILNALNK